MCYPFPTQMRKNDDGTIYSFHQGIRRLASREGMFRYGPLHRFLRKHSSNPSPAFLPSITTRVRFSCLCMILPPSFAPFTKNASSRTNAPGALAEDAGECQSPIRLGPAVFKPRSPLPAGTFTETPCTRRRHKELTFWWWGPAPLDCSSPRCERGSVPVLTSVCRGGVSISRSFFAAYFVLPPPPPPHIIFHLAF